ncbi:MAG: PEP-CTERM sorting domain-containing protein [Phycisphaera sp.]|nr:PEP-CTERM sorting domain-containing protein [Phycisphaera sp.]
MTRVFCTRLLSAVLVALFVNTVASAATNVPLYEGTVNASPTYVAGTGVDRVTLFQSLISTGVTSVGTAFSTPTTGRQFRWTLYNSNSSGTFGTVVGTTSTLSSVAGSQSYFTPVDWDLTLNAYYALRLEFVTGNDYTFTRYDSVVNYTTPGGEFKLTKYGTYNGSSTTYGNGIAPAQILVIPEPGTAILFGLTAVAGIALVRRPRH